MHHGKIAIINIFLCSGLFFTSLAFGQFEIVEPEPFRRDEIGDRSFHYNPQSFIDRFTYRFFPAYFREWEKNRRGFRISAGSVSSDDMFIASQFQEKWFLEENIFGTVQYRRDEDFDSRFDRLLLGAGINFLNNWSFTTLADLAQDKEDIDLRFDLEWVQNPPVSKINYTSNIPNKTTPPIGNRLRISLVLPDNYYNGKSNEGSYENKPLTIFGETALFIGTDSLLHLWINNNFDTQLLLNDDQSTYSYSQFSAGTRADLKVSEYLRLLLRLRGEKGNQERENSKVIHNNQTFDRKNLITETQFDLNVTPSLTLWIGHRYFYLREHDERPLDIQHTRFIKRSENCAHFGLIWSIENNFKFAPGIYLNSIDNTDRFTFNDQPLINDDDVTSRLSLPLLYEFSQHAGRLIIQPNLELPGNIFGGLNVQLQFLL
jgi:hypothetical protein